MKRKKKRESIEVVLKRHEERLLELPGVVGISDGRDANGLYIEVMVEIPPERVEGIPAVLEGYPVRLRYTGRIVARFCS